MSENVFFTKTIAADGTSKVISGLMAPDYLREGVFNAYPAEFDECMALIDGSEEPLVLYAPFGTYRQWYAASVRPKTGANPVKTFSCLDDRLGGQAEPKLYRLGDVETVSWISGEYAEAWLTLSHDGERWQFTLTAEEKDTLSTAHSSVQTEWQWAKGVWDNVPAA